MTESEWIDVSNTLIRYFPTLKDKDGIVMSLWHKKLKVWLKKDVLKAIEFYAIKDKRPSIAGIIELLSVWKSPKDMGQIDMFRDPQTMPYIIPLRNRFKGKTDDELLTIQTDFDRVVQYKLITGTDLKKDEAIIDAAENEKEIADFFAKLTKDDIVLFQKALHLPAERSLFWDWLIWRVFCKTQKGHPHYYNIKTKLNHHVISGGVYTEDDAEVWKKAMNRAKSLTGQTEVRIESEILPLPTLVSVKQENTQEAQNTEELPPEDFDDEDIPF